MMNKWIQSLGRTAFGSVAVLAMLQVPSGAFAAPVAAEKGLLGIRMLAKYGAVLNKYGQPDRIYRVDENVNMDLAVDASNNITGGIRGLGGSTTTAGTPTGGGFGMAGGGRMAGAMGGGMAGRMGGGMPGMMAGAPMGGGGYPGMMGGGPPMGGGGYPGMMGGGMAGMMGGGMGGRATGASTTGGGNTFNAAGGFIWVYFFPKKELVYEFFFNKDGRIEGILERGKDMGMPTSHGIGLGAAIKSLYVTYGWPDSLQTQGPSLSVNYNEKYHTYFSILNNKVIGIAVFLRESQQVRFFDQGTGTGGFGGMAGGGMMGGGRPGMAGRPGMGGMLGGGGGASGGKGD